MPFLFYLLQREFRIRGEVGCSVEEFLVRQCGLDREYISERIKTVFLNGKPVDDVGSAVIGDGDILSLSGAMPGLVGAVMRRGSYYAAFRESITHHEQKAQKRGEEGTVRLKLFNLVMSDRGADFLQRGIYLESVELLEYFSDLPEDFWEGCRSIMLDGEPVAVSDFRKMKSLKSDWTFLQVSAV